ncbi:MAG: site-2 protease family protein [Clostridia bacterium]|nr:site-2 protease family protein [Clostridia bacterium]
MKIRITPGAVLLWLAILPKGPMRLFSTLLAAAIHECGHLLAAHLLKLPLRRMEIDLLGARLYPARALPSYKAEAILAAAGPLFSLLPALVPWRSPFFLALRAASLSFALFNLLPIDGFDGGRLLSALLFWLLGQERGEHLLQWISYFTLLLLFSLSACLLLRYGSDAAMTVVAASLFGRLLTTSPEVTINRQKKARI